MTLPSSSTATHFGIASLLVATLVGCGNPKTQDGAAIRTNVGSGVPATDSVAEPTAPRGEAVVTFNRDVAPIVFRQCSACHRPGEAGPFDLLSYEDTASRAEQIRYVVEERIMPPWLPERAAESYVGNRRLSDAELRTIVHWVEQGAVEGEAGDLPEAPQFTAGWELGEPDLIMDLPQPYELRAYGLDVFHTYVLPIPVQFTRYVKNVEVRPTNRRVVHHALLMIDRTGSLRPLDKRYPGPGFSGTHYGEANWPEGHMPGWLPGRRTFPGRDDIAWRLDPDTDAVLQLHMIPSGKPEQVQIRMGFHFADEKPPREAMLLQMTRFDIDIPAGEKNYEVEDDFVVPVDVEVLAVQPHAHYLGTAMKGFARLPDGTEKSLLDIKQWNFNWQQGYEFVKPVFLPKGTTIEMHYFYDNSAENERNPHNPPRRVMTGWKTSDEMGEFWLQLLPTDPGDLDVLKEENRLERPKDRHAEDVRRWRRAHEKYPNDAATRRRLAVSLGALGHAYRRLSRFEEALANYRAAMDLDPEAPGAHSNLAGGLDAAGRPEDALPHYEEALILYANSTAPRSGLALVHLDFANCLRSLRQFDQALQHYRQSVELNPKLYEALHHWAWLLATCDSDSIRDGAEAVQLATRAARHTGHKDPLVLSTLAAAHAEAGDFDSAVRWQTEAARLASKSQQGAYRKRLQRYQAGTPFREPVE